MHGKKRNARDPQKKRKRVEKVTKISYKISMRIKRNSCGKITQDKSDAKSDDQTRYTKNNIPTFSPCSACHLAAKFNRHSTKDQSGKKDHNHIVKTGSESCIRFGKARKKSSSHNHQPDLITIPNRTYGIKKYSSFLITLCKKMQ